MGLRSHTLYPQFIIFIDGEKHYTSDFTDDVGGFCGWRPYPTKIVEEFANKIAVKKLMIEAGLPTPEFSTDPESALQNVIVKKAVSSFGFSIEGPFSEASQFTLNPEEEEYYEKFTEGTIVKSWFWNNTPVCYEYQDMPNITGNGASSIRHFLDARTEKNTTRPSKKLVENVLSYYGYTVDDVLEDGKELVVDFRYASKFGHNLAIKDVNIEKDDKLNIKDQLQPIGEFAWSHVPDHLKNGLAYSVDAILDTEGKLWFLEINCNPMIHPYLYAPMIDYLHSITDVECLRSLPAHS